MKSEATEGGVAGREVERPIERMRLEKAKAEERARDKGHSVFTMKWLDNGPPEDLRDHTRLMRSSPLPTSSSDPRTGCVEDQPQRLIRSRAFGVQLKIAGNTLTFSD